MKNPSSAVIHSSAALHCDKDQTCEDNHNTTTVSPSSESLQHARVDEERPPKKPHKAFLIWHLSFAIVTVEIYCWPLLLLEGLWDYELSFIPIPIPKAEFHIFFFFMWQIHDAQYTQDLSCWDVTFVKMGWSRLLLFQSPHNKKLSRSAAYGESVSHHHQSDFTPDLTSPSWKSEELLMTLMSQTRQSFTVIA